MEKRINISPVFVISIFLILAFGINFFFMFGSIGFKFTGWVPADVDCYDEIPTDDYDCTNKDLSYSENAAFDVSMSYTDSSISTTYDIIVQEGGDVIYDNLQLDSTGDIIVQNGGSLKFLRSEVIFDNLIIEDGGYVEFSNGGNTVWHNGDWNISGTVVSNHETHRMNVTSDGEFNINVLPGGNLTIMNGSNITNGESLTSEYGFYVNGTFFAEDSYLGKINPLEGIQHLLVPNQ